MFPECCPFEIASYTLKLVLIGPVSLKITLKVSLNSIVNDRQTENTVPERKLNYLFSVHEI